MHKASTVVIVDLWPGRSNRDAVELVRAMGIPADEERARGALKTKLFKSFQELHRGFSDSYDRYPEGLKDLLKRCPQLRVAYTQKYSDRRYTLCDWNSLYTKTTRAR